MVTKKDSSIPLGFLLGFLPKESLTAYIHYLFISEDLRNKGLGSQLLSNFTNVVQEYGAKEVLLYTAKAVNFYKKNGFTENQSIFSKSINEYIENEKNVTSMSRYLE